MFAALIIATVLDLSLALPPSPLLTHAARLHCAAAWTCLQPKVLAEETVISEPVSARWFPVPRENTGKFADFGLEIAKVPRLSEENSIPYQQNSLVA